MNIAAGLTAIKSGFDISSTIAQRVKEGKLSPAEINDLLLRLREALLDSQSALNQAAEENRALREELSNNNWTAEIEKDLRYVADGGFFVRNSEQAAGTEIVYCPLCWGSDSKLVPLNPGSGTGHYYCSIHKASYETASYRERQRSSAVRLNRTRSKWP